ncbi:cupin domain-containing protein [Acetobacterium paludosum]|uniref:Cupin domain-containing protein n=1 Tax=Acetobacterium paludosum TaxID=52693 RepID=A0A923HVN0_9FIRM|nr:cupin domain-containing protein [Acetobacterium paludosum]MBC3888027.1 cupin domain-containing protein [Acetobacterium paludosum]
MKYYVRLRDVEETQRPDYTSRYLVDEKNGCVAGCKTGISCHIKTAYPNSQAHADQEGFLVLEGTGWAKVGDQEFKLEPETSFIVPAGVQHALKRDENSVSLKVFWFHAAI